MKLKLDHSVECRGETAFTLAEALVALTIVILSSMALLLFNLYGIAEATKQTLVANANDSARETIGHLMQDVRSAQTLQVGNGGLSGFTNVSGTNQGNSLYISNYVNSSASWIMYFYNQSSNATVKYNNCLVRTNYYGSGYSTNTLTVVAKNITNDSYIFQGEDYTGSDTASTIYEIEVYLSYIKTNYSSMAALSSTAPTSFYTIRTRIASRILQ